MATAIDRLREHLAEISDLRCASSVLGWDQQTYMPPGGGAQRAQQLATLRRLSHAKFTSEETLRLLDAAETETNGRPDDDENVCLVRIVRRDYERSRKLPTEFVAAWAQDGALSNQVWRAARKANDFPAFRPHLEKMVDYARRAADYYGFADHPYDALLDGFEPGMKARDVKRTFDTIRPVQVELARAIAAKQEPRHDFITRDYPEEGQRAFSLAVAADFGYDLERGRLDIAPHPFCTDFGQDDVRITTRYDRHFLPQAVFATFHETGHALYEQNVAPSLARTPLDSGCSNVFHESQSRLWENVVGRSEAFWQRYFPKLRETFPQALGDVSAAEFYRAVNRVKPILIRVESDEVTYNLHIMLRFDLELALVEGNLKVADLPAAWAEKMDAYLGVTPPDDADGVMQDTHWSTGSIGYFPTYALGNVLAAQIYERALSEQPELPDQLASGNFAPLLGWLKEKIYVHGRKFLPADLAVRVTGRPLEPGPYLNYLQRKFGGLYGV